MKKRTEKIPRLLALALLATLLPGAVSPAGDTIYARLEKLAPEGFSISRPLQFYGTAERKLKDGSIFNYMDGGGVAYLEHGFVELFHAEYADGSGGEITLDVFTMGSAPQARGALEDERVCPAAGAPLAPVPSGRAFRFPPDYFIYFASGRRLVYLHVNDDRLGLALDRFAGQVHLITAKEEK